MATELQGLIAKDVGCAFVHQYYATLLESPEEGHQFYMDESKLVRPEDNGGMSVTTTRQAIHEKILSFGYGGIKAEILTVDSHESYKCGVLVLVTGYYTTKANIRRKFTQSFFLAPVGQVNSYFVLNDVFRYGDDAKDQNEHNGPINETEVPPQTQDSSTVLENHVTEQPVGSSEVGDEWEIYDPYENVVAVEEEEAAIILDETAVDIQTVSGSNTKVEVAPRKSYASSYLGFALKW